MSESVDCCTGENVKVSLEKWKIRRKTLIAKINVLNEKIDKIQDVIDDWDDRANFFGNDGIDYSFKRLEAA